VTLALHTESPHDGPQAALLARLASAGPVEAAVSALVDDAAALWSRPGFDTLASVPRLRFTPFPHQLQAARSALRRMRGRAILADEVGLGKTIEAGLVLSELRLRGLADRTLVVVPAGLADQWQEELDRKFALPSTVAAGGGWTTSPDRPVVVASLAAARRDPLRAALTAQPWDLVVLDEAHRVKNPRSASGRFARALRARYLLLLTATPVENRLEELFELVSLVSPGLLGTPAEFRTRHGGGDGQPRDVAGLQARTREVMVRHRRSDVAVLLPQRLAETVRVSASEQEQVLYDEIVARVRDEGRTAAPPRRLALRAVAQLAGSSPAAVAPTLDRLGWQDLSRRAAAIAGTEKSRVLLALLRRHLARGEKVVVFTAYRQTLALLAASLVDAGVPTAVYHGGLSRSEKERAIAAFRDELPVLPTTEAAGEGRNLQFCHVMVNVDHGRIDPSGQTPFAAYTPVLRVGALVTYHVTFDDRFQERQEVWVDAVSGLSLSPALAAALAGTAPSQVLAHRVLPADRSAAQVAQARLERAGAARLAALVGQSRGSQEAELARVQDYYRSALDALARRRATAPADRWDALDARAEATRAERERRLAEVEEKFRGSQAACWYRVHELLVRAVSVPVTIRRPAGIPLQLPLAAAGPRPCHRSAARTAPRRLRSRSRRRPDRLAPCRQGDPLARWLLCHLRRSLSMGHDGPPTATGWP